MIHPVFLKVEPRRRKLFDDNGAMEELEFIYIIFIQRGFFVITEGNMESGVKKRRCSNKMKSGFGDIFRI